MNGVRAQNRSSLSKIAIVTPWFGEDAKGGAEQQALQLATRLGRAGHRVDVLTTCNRSFLTDWSTDHFRAGVSYETHYVVQRFPVDSRDAAAFDRANGKLLSVPKGHLHPGISPVEALASDVFFQESINSTTLVDYIRRESASYDAFIFLPYLYGVVLRGIAACDPEKAYLQPCLHDEVYAYLPQVVDMMHQAGHLLFLSDGEKDLAMRIYGPSIATKSSVPGAGVEIESIRPGVARTLPRGLDAVPYVLCLGRRDRTKNTEMLIDAYRAFRQSRPHSALRLVLAGPGQSTYDAPGEGIDDFGLVDTDLKHDLVRGCRSLFQPSENESFSRVIMEAWTAGRPVAAHSRCAATARAVGEAKGGFLATTLADWAGLFGLVEDTNVALLNEMGHAGKLHVENNLGWDRVIERYSASLSPRPGAKRHGRKRSIAIHQMLPNLDVGDAISNQALAIRSYLRSEGYESEIIIRYRDPRLAREVKVFPSFEVDPDAAIIYHHSIGSELTQPAASHRGPKCLVYHNITPSAFFEHYDAPMAELLAEGRRQLADITMRFDYAFGDSDYNASELRELGIPSAEVLPIVVEPGRWKIRPCPRTVARMSDGHNNLLFVGRIAPNKAQHDLVRAFAEYRSMDGRARLILAGRYDPDSLYYQELLQTIRRLGLEDSVELTGGVTEEQLMAYYTTAQLFWSMSEHEGFGVPLIEAMWFDVPVLAYRSSAVPETLGSSGVMFTTKANMLHLAALAKVMVHDRDLRARVIGGQHRQRERFRGANVAPSLRKLVARLDGHATAHA